MSMNLKIEYVPVGSIKGYERNAKLHPAEQIEQIKRSIQDYGFNDPIGVWHDTIVEGHGRLIAAKDLGMESVPIIRLDEMTDEQRKEYALVHNKLTMNSDFDVELLDFELDSLPDFDADFYGFDPLADEEEEREIVDDETPAPPEEPKTKLGDLFDMGGRHRLICGDCTDHEVIKNLMGGVTADISITSPPYGAGNVAKLRDHYEKGKEQRESFYNKHKDDPDEWRNLIQGAFKTMREASSAQFINVQMLADNKRDLIGFVHENDDFLCDVIVWDKENAPPQMNSNILNNEFEFVFIFGEAGATRTVPFADWHGNKNNVIKLTTGKNEYADIHRAVFPTQFPAELMKIANNAKSVLDVFGGTGTTLIACEQLNRKCYMCELDPRYCDVIIERWENFTGEKAVKISGD